jgi:hypothetical protein
LLRDAARRNLTHSALFGLEAHIEQMQEFLLDGSPVHVGSHANLSAHLGVHAQLPRQLQPVGAIAVPGAHVPSAAFSPRRTTDYYPNCQHSLGFPSKNPPRLLRAPTNEYSKASAERWALMEAEPPVEYLLEYSRESLRNFTLAQLNKSANSRKKLRAAIEEWVEARAMVLFADWLTEHGEELVALAAAPRSEIKIETEVRRDAKPRPLKKSRDSGGLSEGLIEDAQRRSAPRGKTATLEVCPAMRNARKQLNEYYVNKTAKWGSGVVRCDAQVVCTGK